MFGIRKILPCEGFFHRIWQLTTKEEMWHKKIPLEQTHVYPTFEIFTQWKGKSYHISGSLWHCFTHTHSDTWVCGHVVQTVGEQFVWFMLVSGCVPVHVYQADGQPIPNLHVHVSDKRPAVAQGKPSGIPSDDIWVVLECFFLNRTESCLWNLRALASFFFCRTSLLPSPWWCMSVSVCARWSSNQSASS